MAVPDARLDAVQGMSRTTIIIRRLGMILLGVKLSDNHTGIASISRVARVFDFKNGPSTSNVALAVVNLIR